MQVIVQKPRGAEAILPVSLLRGRKDQKASNPPRREPRVSRISSSPTQLPPVIPMLRIGNP